MLLRACKRHCRLDGALLYVKGMISTGQSYLPLSRHYLTSRLTATGLPPPGCQLINCFGCRPACSRHVLTQLKCAAFNCSLAIVIRAWPL